MNNAECEMLAELERVKVVPNFSEPTLYLITGDVGPFEAGVPVDVPAWIAIYLKQCYKCRFRVVPPDWLNIVSLETMIANERDERTFTKVPGFWMCLSHLLIQHAADDIPDCDKITVLIKDLWDVRQAKLRTSMGEFLTSGEQHAVVTNLTPFELNSYRALSTSSLCQIDRLRQAAEQVQE